MDKDKEEIVWSYLSKTGKHLTRMNWLNLLNNTWTSEISLNQRLKVFLPIQC